MKKVLAQYLKDYIHNTTPRALKFLTWLNDFGDEPAVVSERELIAHTEENVARLLEILEDDGIITYLAQDGIDGVEYTIRLLPEVSFSTEPYYNGTVRVYIRQTTGKRRPTFLILPEDGFNELHQSVRYGYAGHEPGELDEWLRGIATIYPTADLRGQIRLANSTLPGAKRNVNVSFYRQANSVYWAVSWMEDKKTQKRVGPTGLHKMMGGGEFNPETQRYENQPSLNEHLAYVREMLTKESRRLPVLSAQTIGDLVRSHPGPLSGGVEASESKPVFVSEGGQPNGPSAVVAAEAPASESEVTEEDLSEDFSKLTKATQPGLSEPELLELGAGLATVINQAINTPNTTVKMSESPDPNLAYTLSDLTGELVVKVEETLQQGAVPYLVLTGAKVGLVYSQEQAERLAESRTKLTGQPSIVLRGISLSKAVQQVVIVRIDESHR